MNLIVAVDNNWGIGHLGTQPVIIPEDRHHFKALTDGGTVIVGHRTLLDFPNGKPLVGRRNIVFSRHEGLKIDGAVCVSSLETLYREISQTEPDKVFVIGGERIFKFLLPYCTLAYVTKIDASPEADTFFPNLDALDTWALEDPGTQQCSEGINYRFQVFKNSSPRFYDFKE